LGFLDTKGVDYLIAVKTRFTTTVLIYPSIPFFLRLVGAHGVRP
jgi:hypothetical protein